MDKKKALGYLRNLAIFLLLIFLTMWFLLKDQDPKEFAKIISNSKIEYILIGIACMSAFVCMEANNIGRMLKHLGEKSTFLKNVKYALIGIFFSAITPAASGGQPMQIYFMHKDGISIGSSTFTLLLNITCLLITTVSLGFINLAFNYQYMTTGLMIFYVFGQVINLIAIVLFLIAIFSHKVLDKIILFFKNVLRWFTNKKIKRIQKLSHKNIEQKVEKAENSYDHLAQKLDDAANQYKKDSVFVKENKSIVIKTLILYFIQYAFYFQTAYWAYLAIGQTTHSWFEITSLQSVVYATTSGIPLPGAVGASESAYLGWFKNVIPTELITSEVLINRFINFYLFVIISAFVVLFTIIKTNKKEKKEAVEATK